MDIGYCFPEDISGQWDGFNHTGLEHFTGDPLENLGREIVQNVLDAVDSYPAKVAINLLDIPKADIPGICELEDVLDLPHMMVPVRELVTGLVSMR